MTGRNHQISGSSIGAIALPMALAVAGLATVSLFQLSADRTDRDVTAIFAPHVAFDDAASRVNRAGAAVLGVGAAGNIVIARTSDDAARKALKDEGAWLLLTAATAEFCTGKTRSPVNAFQQPS